ncbi:MULTISPECIES: ATP-binding cassette domain-containing protein [Sporosarcina]|uniref:ATP-binding cassette domain-containing protein n=1 Tax=Sporosarcina TaxID=1569 RepID=UPI00129BC1C7|nr:MULTISPECIES: ATP-binding cassette domain-containing protein [Sporosarcina]GKV63862.1 peptide ABC transporter ATP-binding protein [Sporosarcina sp. NCCP-2331]GLB54641.1 peptide ABC transporter ATP-binding protein [Sporosarcina sp. NCCP-2378]
MSLLQLRDVSVHYTKTGSFFKRKSAVIPVIAQLSLELRPGEIYGLVGESGCGKSTAAKAIIGLHQLSAGQIFFNGEDLSQLTRKARKQQMKEIQMIFQDPYSSLNPRKNVWNIIAEPLRNFEKLSKADELKKVQKLLQRVGLNEESVYQYPHQFSGGQRQRIGIARAMALQPQLLIADEPVSALDVSVQAQVLNFMKEIQEEFRLTMLFISHDLGVVRHLCDRIGIMYRGSVVEEGTVEDIFRRPQHLYTKRLLAAMPEMDPEKRQHKIKQRLQINEEFDRLADTFLDAELQQISDTHWARL